MNRFMEETWPWIEGSHAMRDQLLDTLSNAELAYSPGGENRPLGILCLEMGETEYSYMQSLKTFQQAWSYGNQAVGLESNIVQLKTWFQTLDAEMLAVLSAFSDEDLQKRVDRNGFTLSVEYQLQVYLQALLIFFGKVTVYFKTMSKPLPQQFHDYIG